MRFEKDEGGNEELISRREKTFEMGRGGRGGGIHLEGRVEWDDIREWLNEEEEEESLRIISWELPK